MNEHDATEAAFKNGYQRGTIDTALKMRSEIKARCLEKGIFPAIVARILDDVAKEMLEGQKDDE